MRDDDEDQAEDIVDDEGCADKRDDERLRFHGRLHFEVEAYPQAVL